MRCFLISRLVKRKGKRQGVTGIESRSPAWASCALATKLRTAQARPITSPASQCPALDSHWLLHFFPFLINSLDIGKCLFLYQPGMINHPSIIYTYSTLRSKINIFIYFICQILDFSSQCIIMFTTKFLYRAAGMEEEDGVIHSCVFPSDWQVHTVYMYVHDMPTPERCQIIC